MSKLILPNVSRRTLLTGTGATLATTAVPTGWAIAQGAPLKVGLMLPYSGTFAKLGENITHAVEMVIAEKGGKLGGRAYVAAIGGAVAQSERTGRAEGVFLARGWD